MIVACTMGLAAPREARAEHNHGGMPKHHASTLPRSKRNGAPIYHDYDSLLGVLEAPDHIDQQAGSGPKAENELMPPDRCPSEPGGALSTSRKTPTVEEREHLAMWIACERNRPHTF